MSRKLFTLVSLVLIASFVLSACSPKAAPAALPTATQIAIPTAIPTATPTALPAATPTKPAPTPSPIMPFPNGEYRNLFKEYLGKSDADVQAKLEAAWQQLFYGDDATQRVYYPVGDDMANIVDPGNNDVRTEGMSYGLMLAVQFNKKAEFDRLWKWAKTYMYQSDLGPYQGYFAWHCHPDGKKIDQNPASDGEEWFVMDLFFAAARWGNGDGIFNYQAQAQEILNTMLHRGDKTGNIAMDMFNPVIKQAVFVPTDLPNFTDPSYHLPFFYELWGRWASQDNQFWFDAEKTSREFYKKAANPQTGLMPNYTAFDGTQYPTESMGLPNDFRWDAWRTLAYPALDYSWYGADPWEVEQSNRVLTFLASKGVNSFPNFYKIDGTPLPGAHETGPVAMAAVAAQGKAK